MPHRYFLTFVGGAKVKQLLYAESVSKKIGSKQILQNISLNLSGGNVYGFVGENGSGKTMLFRILSGLVKPTTGKVCLNRTDIHKGRCSERIGVIIENSCMWPELTGWENLLFLGSLNKRISKADIRTTLERVGLDPTNPLPIKKYSLGMRQRLIVAQAIMEKPNFLFLDEPTNAIDKEGVFLIRDIIAEEANRGAVVLLASHISQDISTLCTEIYHMKHGRIEE
jgi:bacitracin transport ATP-binding protein BcrA